MKRPPAKCPRCQKECLFLWCRETQAFCDDCATRLGSSDFKEFSTFRLLVDPRQSATGSWHQPEDIDFGKLREFVEGCMRPQSARQMASFLIQTPRAIAAIIDILESMLPAPLAQKEERAVNNVDTEIYKLTIAIYQEERLIALTRKASKIRARMKHIKGLRARLATLESGDITAGASNEMNKIRSRAVQRLKRDFELWQRGALEVHFSVPVHRVHWQLLKPSGDSWQELVRHFEYLSKVRNESYDIERIKTVHDFEPDEIFVGSQSFEGYVVFCFKIGETAVLECPKVGNALYMLDLKQWRTLSQLSKTELLTHHTREAKRLIHSSAWASELGLEFRSRGIGEQTKDFFR